MLVLEFIFRALPHIFRAKSIQPPSKKMARTPMRATVVVVVVQELGGGEQLGSVLRLSHAQTVQVSLVELAQLVQTREAARQQQRRQLLCAAATGQQQLHRVSGKMEPVIF